MEQGKGMNKKTALMIGGGILLLGVGFFIFKKIRDKKKYASQGFPNTGGGGNYQGGGNTYTGGGNTSTTPPSGGGGGFDPSYPASQIYKSMKGIGTDEDLFFSTARSLSSSERQKVKEYFNDKYGDLKDWIEGDFSWGDEDDALALFGY
tara:strand:+ start:370 stop:816 length:447 start_codon:yes stop_codon:yes gene_type:complete